MFCNEGEHQIRPYAMDGGVDGVDGGVDGVDGNGYHGFTTICHATSPVGANLVFAHDDCQDSPCDIAGARPR